VKFDELYGILLEMFGKWESKGAMSFEKETSKKIYQIHPDTLKMRL